MNFKSKEPSFFASHDGLQLAYYPFVPDNPKTTIVFYHGGGGWSMPIYQQMANAASQRYGIAVYLIDVRGHGHSEGPRGDSFSPQHVWNDVDSAIDLIKKNHPEIPLLLSGHSSGSSLILNYIAQTEVEKVDGYIFLAPFLGNETARKHTQKKERFVTKINFFRLLGYKLTGGKLFGHKPMVFFNHGDLLNTTPLLVSSYTATMATAVFPQDAQSVLCHLIKPCAIFIGENDEQFNHHRLVAHQKYFQNHTSFARVISNASHLSIVRKGADLFEEAVRKFFIEKH